MKLESLYNSILEEGISPIVYHVTSAEKFIQMMRTDSFKASPTGGRFSMEFDISKNRHFYFSTARSKQSSYIMDEVKGANTSTLDFPVIIKLDGRKLQQKLKGSSVIYGAAYEELEDRIITDSPRIQNASSYIMSVDLIVNTIRDRGIASLQQVVSVLKDKRISFLVYDSQDFRAAIQNNTKKALEQGELNSLLGMSIQKTDVPIRVDDVASTAQIKELEIQLDFILAMYNLAYKNDASGFRNQARMKDFQQLFNEWYGKIASYDSINLKNGMMLRSLVLTDKVTLIAKLSRRHGASNIAEFGKHLILKLEKHTIFN